MKELSIEEKAKHYDEAIKRVEDIKTGKCETRFMFTEGLFEFIFPALKESEDERIIGNIIATIHLYYGEPLEDEAKEMIAWLERRGQTFSKKDVDDAYLKGVCDAKHELEKQGKNNMGISEATKQKLEDNLNKALEKETPESWNKFLDEQKSADTEKGANGNERENPISAWSEEDEINLNAALSYIKDEALKAFVKKRIQPKQEWSQEDEDVINHLLAICAGAKRYRRQFAGCLQEDITKYQNWLKSLKERYTWKPSDEQMEALLKLEELHVLEHEKNQENAHLYMVIKSIREQLLKLREE